MKPIDRLRRLPSSLVAGLLLLQISPMVASGQADTQSTVRPPAQADQPVNITFTKWRTAGVPIAPATATRTLFAGFVGGDLGDGSFIGEVIDRKVSTRCGATDPACVPANSQLPPPATITGPIIALQAIYEVQAGDRSFVALIQGGTNGVTGAALLEGVVLAGWRTGAPVHVAFQTTTNCAGAPEPGTCFQGTIRVDRAAKQ